MRVAKFCVAAVVLCIGVGPAHAERVTLPATRDNTLFESQNGSLSSGLGPSLFSGTTAGLSNRRALLRFDLTGVPAGATIDSVQLVLHLNRTQDSEVRSFALHAVSKTWGEGNSNAGGPPGQGGGGGGAPAAAGDATWVHNVFPNQTWASRGGDFTPAPSATAALGREGTYRWGSTPAMVADVQRWLDMQVNDGWILIGSEEPTTARRFDSRESPNASDRPKLIVDFTGLAVEPRAWSAIKSLFR